MKSFPNYQAYANQYIYNINIPGCSVPGGRMFVGQRKDPFVVNLGETFDLVNYANPIGEQFSNSAIDSLADKNVTSLILEIPTSCLTTSPSQPIIGGWTTASLPQLRVLSSLSPESKSTSTLSSAGRFVQASRLANPLVNELVIGLKDKDRFISSEPEDDAQFAHYVTNPSFPSIIGSLFAGAGVKAPTLFPRTDLVATFLTGIKGLNQPANVTPAEEMRLNTSIPIIPVMGSGLLSVGFGLFLAYQIGITDHLFGITPIWTPH